VEPVADRASVRRDGSDVGAASGARCGGRAGAAEAALVRVDLQVRRGHDAVDEREQDGVDERGDDVAEGGDAGELEHRRDGADEGAGDADDDDDDRESEAVPAREAPGPPERADDAPVLDADGEDEEQER
jgi:hypothetical protein